MRHQTRRHFGCSRSRSGFKPCSARSIPRRWCSDSSAGTIVGVGPWGPEEARMRRRLVDLGLTAVGAAALLGLIKALPLLAAFITLPTTWTAGQILTSSDLNAEFAAVSAQVNGNLDDTNIVAGAAIKGSKLADSPNGLTTTKLNDLAVTGGKLADLAVTGGKLAVNAAIHAQTSAVANAISVTAGSGAMT